MSTLKSPEPSVSRRDWLRMIGGGFGLYGYASLLGHPWLGAAPLLGSAEPLAVNPTHFPARAKRVIFLFMNGGLSSVDTFDPKPLLTRHHGQSMPGGYVKTERKTGNLMRSPFHFKRYGQSGIEVSQLFSQVAEHIDDICVIRSMFTAVPNHPPGMFLMNCGHLQPRRPLAGVLDHLWPRHREPESAGFHGALSFRRSPYRRRSPLELGLFACGLPGDPHS